MVVLLTLNVLVQNILWKLEKVLKQTDLGQICNGSLCSKVFVPFSKNISPVKIFKKSYFLFV